MLLKLFDTNNRKQKNKLNSSWEVMEILISMSSMKNVSSLPVIYVGYKVIMIGNKAIDYQHSRQMCVDSDISPHCSD